MPGYTDHDLDLCKEVAHLDEAVTRREVRGLREYGAIETTGTGKGGRGKSESYRHGSAEVVAAIQTAKRHELYRHKLWRAVLIAWSHRAAVGTNGLRRAFEEYLDYEERGAQDLLDGKRKEGEPEIDLPPALFRAIAAAELGLSRSSNDVGTFEATTGSLVRAAFWRSGNRSLLPANPDTIGLATQRADKTWAVSEMAATFWEALALAPLRPIARGAPRAELDAALRLSEGHLPAHGFKASDLVVATGALRQAQWMRRDFGESWWEAPRK